MYLLLSTGILIACKKLDVDLLVVMIYLTGALHNL